MTNELFAKMILAIFWTLITFVSIFIAENKAPKRIADAITIIFSSCSAFTIAVFLHEFLEIF